MKPFKRMCYSSSSVSSFSRLRSVPEALETNRGVVPSRSAGSRCRSSRGAGSSDGRELETISYNWESAMTCFHEQGFLFCRMCGTLLSFNSPKFAECPLCGFKHSAREIEGKEIRYTITAEDIRRELKIEPFVVLESAKIEEEKVQRAVVNETCPQCNNSQLEYYTKQLRSADEGQTVFYECPKCRYKYSMNT